ncbi:mandelate racemase/muconate lactonizing enzyme family protein [Natronosalvus rutilus]|uniref:o-succinylbenzoate synthase n=1 Tax=Natronosalvus rutilus TaxID=2953753 RepID=A0A9E7N8Y8_9EURY|nr:o-succinylbenzoate synthase [Natronosalvus rutilus]UTF53046.1 o-succinylbenzoate synthase [Natronosalvus rutilus]
MSLDLQFRPFELELEQPFESGDATITTREGFLIRAEFQEVVGIGEATPLPGWTESLEDCECALEEAVDAADDGSGAVLDAVEDTAAARHGVSLAIADCYATRGARPLYQYLGDGSRVARVPVNSTVGDDDADATAAAARDAVDRGFRSCKLKVGRRSVDEDLTRVERVREAVGDDVEVRVDANGSWTFDEAVEAIRGLDDADVSIVEQPLPAGALEGHADLRGRGPKIALDEGLLEHGVDAICEASAADVLILKPMALGGLDVAREVVTWTDELGLESLVTTTIDGVVARTAAVHLAASVPDVPPCGLATGELLKTDLGRDPVLFEKGAAVVPQAKGLGIDDVWGAT